MSTVNIDWNTIHPLSGSRANGFEEMCAQLASAESPAGSRFERKGAPDAGVECYAVLADGSEWGWQAKYFDGLGRSQWSQLDNSVKTALVKHPRLVRYFVCIPLDLADARIETRRSEKDRWNEHVQKWTGWATDCGMAVKFVYWGSHELLQRLAHPQHVGRVRFWFDVLGFDEAWFIARLEEALKSAGPRYTPEIHVDLPISAEFEAFGRTDQFFNRIKTHADDIRKRHRFFEYSTTKSIEPRLDASISELSSKVQVALSELGAVVVQPVVPLPFKRIADLMAGAEEAANEVKRLLLECEGDNSAKPPARGADTEGTATSLSNDDPFRELRYNLNTLSHELRKSHKALSHAESVAGRSMMLLSGAAGTGKTHLLCDLSRQRLAAGRPTVLLMGQRFVSMDEPWIQALHQLDLPGFSAEEFVGALEAAAQAAGNRALVMIDAINEGSGRLLWTSHLAAFLAHLQRSAWIGTILSIRSSYEDIIVPAEIRAHAARITHHGFAEREYEATRRFFIHYGLELPSTPLLSPEFSNPLFLKTLCRGLHMKGERRLPRGFHGISAVFELYLNAVNDRLASELDFNPKDPLVNKALTAVAKALVCSGESWLGRAQAEEVVNAFLEGRGFERSLYRGLVLEGVLVEEGTWRREAADQEVVFMSYDRFADHLVAKTLLDSYLEADAPASAFAAGAPLAFFCDKHRYVSPGLIEAMCIQIAERTGQELISLAPNIVERGGVGDAFRQSLVWRAPEAFSEDTRQTLNKLLRTQHDFDDTLDALLTIATLPDHPLNARFLDKHLRRDPMPVRDAWWSIYLHKAWGNRGAVDRLVDWASSVTSSVTIDNEAVDLCATVLSWMLTTSNRFLRDSATQALVSLLTGRLGAVVRLVDRFSDVDDPYVAERIYAVAYGTAMRSHDPVEVGALAMSVYDRVFAGGAPPAHILLRDYARGVVERAIYLGAEISVVAERIRPPYASQWPVIPTEDKIKPFLPDWSSGSYDSGKEGWARNRIGSSVMDDDFARYVIDTRFSGWLSLRLEEPDWQSPDACLAMLLEGFSDDERTAWEKYKAVDDAIRWLSVRKRFAAIQGDAQGEINLDGETQVAPTEEAGPELQRMEQERDATLAALETTLTRKHARDMEALLTAMNRHDNSRHPPRIDLRLIKRYILWRVFDLGWSTECFGEFDRLSIGYHGREASKAERIGKKYQWIALHEISALVADHFQYREEFREEHGARAYDGPWQQHLRDIDPSCTIRAPAGGTSWEGHSPAWWGTTQYENWEDPSDPREWVKRYDNLPKMEDLLRISNPKDASRWINAQGYFNWKQPRPVDRESTDLERRDLWYICTGYLVCAQDLNALMKWAEGVDFWGRWMPEPPEVYCIFLGEHCWSPASRYFQQPYFRDEGWTKPNCECPAKVRAIAFNYIREAGGFDCSVDESFTLRLPASELLTGLGLRWSGNVGDYLDARGQLAASDPTAYAEGPSALLLREDLLKEFLEREKLSICWTILGEKRALGPGYVPAYYMSLRLSGAYTLGEKGPVGFLKCTLDEREVKNTGTSSKLLATIRCPA